MYRALFYGKFMKEVAQMETDEILKRMDEIRKRNTWTDDECEKYSILNLEWSNRLNTEAFQKLYGN